MSEDKMLEAFYKKYGTLKDYDGDGGFYYAMLGAFALAWQEREKQEDIAALRSGFDAHERNKNLIQEIMYLLDVSDCEELPERINHLRAVNVEMVTRVKYARKALTKYQDYRKMNTLNFQLEKADSYIFELAAALEDK